MRPRPSEYAVSCRIVKPFDWQFIRSTRLDVIVEGVDHPGHIARIFSYDGYFHVAPGARVPLAEAELTPLPGGIAQAVFEGAGPWGACVLGVHDAAGTEVTASGIKFGRSEGSNWIVPAPTGDGEPAQFPLPLATSALSHTPADEHPELTVVQDVAALCDLPGDGRAGLLGAAPVSRATRFNGLDSLSLRHSLGKDHPAFSDMLGLADWTSVVPYVARFRDTVAQVPSSLVIFDGMLWSDSTVTAFFNDPELRQHPSLFRAFGEAGFLGNATDSSEILAANGLDRFPGIPLLLTNAGYRNHAHWILNTVLAAFYCRDAVLDGRICLLVPEYSDYIFASLMSLGIPRSAILVAPRGFYRFADVLFPSTLSTHVNRAPPPEIGAMFDMIRAHCRARIPARGPRLVYFTRQGSGAARKIGNEDALIAALKERGFVVIAPHELTFEEEVTCVSEADVIVGQLGAALMNIAFAPRTAWVVELASHNYTSPDYWMLATTLGQRFVRILARADAEETLTLTDFSFDIPLVPTLDSIDRIIADLGPSKGASA